MLSAGLLLFAIAGATSLVSASVKVTLCHATPPDTGAGGWHTVTTDTSSDGSLKGGHDSSHDADIIPAYVDPGKINYPGKNLTTDFGGVTGQQILDNDCASPAGTGGPLPSGGGAGDTNQPPTDALAGDTGSSGPSQTAWLLVVALGVILASVVILTPARAKSRR